MNYTHETIKKILDNGKQPFIRLLPLEDINVKSAGGNMPVKRPTRYGTIVTQDTFLRELNPSSHKIFNKSIYPDKMTATEFDEKGDPISWSLENIARIAFAMQMVIKTKQKNHLTGKPLKLTFTNNKPTPELEDLYTQVRQTCIDKNIDIAFAEAVESQLTTGDTAIYYFMDNKKLDWEVFSYSKGDVLIPIYSSVNRLQTLYRYFSAMTEEGGQEEAMMIIDDKYVTEFRKRRRRWVQTDQKLHGFEKLPVAYKRGTVAWDAVQYLIEEFEWAFSQFCESNSFFAFPILFLQGEFAGLPKKGSQGKVLEGGENTKANFLSRNGGDMDAFKYQVETMLNMIFMGSFTVNVTPDSIKTSGDTPGAAIRLIMHPEIDKAIELSKEWDDFVDNMKDLFLEGIGRELSITTQIKELKIRMEIDIYVPENEQEIVNMLNQSVTMGSLSSKTASERNPYAVSNEADRINKEKEEELKREKEQKSTNTVVNSDGTQMASQNLKQEISSE